MNIHLHAVKISAFALVAVLGAGQAFGQAAAPAAPGDKAESHRDNGQDIIVTARKREERLIDVPVAISVLSSRDLKRYATNSFQDVASLTPELKIGDSTTQAGGSVALRGVGAGIGTSSLDSAVTLNIDGVPLSQASVLRVGQFDLERVEILKGPQALFYGKNSPAGVISVVSADPGPNLEAKIRTGYEFYNRQKFIEGTVSGPVTDTFGARLDGYVSGQTGWFRNAAPPAPGVDIPTQSTFPDNQEYFGRLTLNYAPSTKFSVKLKVAADHLSRHSGVAEANQVFYCPTYYTSDDTCKADRYYSVGGQTSVASLNPLLGNGQPYFHSNIYLASLAATYKPSDVITVSSVTGFYRARDGFANEFSGDVNPNSDSLSSPTIRPCGSLRRSYACNPLSRSRSTSWLGASTRISNCFSMM